MSAAALAESKSCGAVSVKKMPSKADLLQQEVDLQRAAVADLKKELVKRELPVNGLKAELIARLNEYEASRA